MGPSQVHCSAGCLGITRFLVKEKRRLIRREQLGNTASFRGDKASKPSPSDSNPICPQRRAIFRFSCLMLQRKLTEIQHIKVIEWPCGGSRHCKCSLFYQAMTAVYGPSYQTLSLLPISDDNKRLTDKASIVGR